MNDNDIERSIADVLRPHGEGEVDVTALRAGTMVRVRAAHRRRSAFVAAGAAATIALSVMTGQRLLAAGGDGPSAGGAPASVSGAPDHPVAPADSLPAADAPGAAARPDTVGSDRALLHFDLDLATFDGTGTWWMSTLGVEMGSVWTGGTGPGSNYHKAATVTLSQSLDDARAGSLGGSNAQMSGEAPVPVTVAGRPGTIQEFPNAWNSGQPVWVLWWQPVDGLWAVLEMPAGDAVTVVAATAGLRLDRSQRCAVPVRIATPPAGTQWASCSTDLEPLDATGRSWRTAALTFCNDLGGALTLSYGNYSDDAVEGDKFVHNRTVNGRPAMWYAGQSGWQLVVPGTDGRNMFIGIRGDGFDDEDALALANAAVLSEDLVNLDTWPARAVG